MSQIESESCLSQGFNFKLGRLGTEGKLCLAAKRVILESLDHLPVLDGAGEQESNRLGQKTAHHVVVLAPVIQHFGANFRCYDNGTIRQ